MSPHGMPTDLLDRMLIVRTTAYTEDELKIILQIRLVKNDTKNYYTGEYRVVGIRSAFAVNIEYRVFFWGSKRSPIEILYAGVMVCGAAEATGRFCLFCCYQPSCVVFGVFFFVSSIFQIHPPPPD